MAEVALEAAPTPKAPAVVSLVRDPDTGLSLMEYAHAAIQSGFAPRGFRSLSQVLFVCQCGAELGLRWGAALRGFYVAPSGRPSMFAEIAHALAWRSGLLEAEELFEEGAGENLTGVYRYKRKGAPKWSESRFPFSRALTAGLVKPDSGWRKWPERLVRARALAFGLHDGFPDVLFGIAIEGDGREEEPKAGDLAPVEVEGEGAPSALAGSLPPPEGEDPLLAAILGGGAAAPEVVEAEAVEAPPPRGPDAAGLRTLFDEREPGEEG